MASHSKEDVRSILQAHFANTESSKEAGKQWDKLWQAGDFLPWDRGTFNPALEDTLKEQKTLLGSSPFVTIDGQRRRKRALVPGCGRGYDVLLLSSFGYDAYGLEISSGAVKAAQKLEGETAKNYPAVDSEAGKGAIKYITADFFSKDWEKEVEGDARFEAIYDYTFLCALDPSLRPSWAQRMSELLSKDPAASLICLEFPTYKDPESGGPPYALPQIVYKSHLSHPGKKIAYNSDQRVDDGNLPKDLSENALVPAKRWRPARTHEAGKDTDWVSIWKKQT